MPIAANYSAHSATVSHRRREAARCGVGGGGRLVAGRLHLRTGRPGEQESRGPRAVSFIARKDARNEGLRYAIMERSHFAQTEKQKTNSLRWSQNGDRVD